MAVLRKAEGNWVEGDRFFDREAEIEALVERVRREVRRVRYGRFGASPASPGAGPARSVKP